ncbi:uncharacterized protein LOC100249671 isoform X1 [Vitis vinifera]|uniref:uncharacterized protein LOC100249671 isoform X1 n=1 Tax=Vitis vinifera TaxID=29760 RepID=UPI00023B22A8|nr:uncharacterized protein LOC100249671 isoform X1 [Vitis vinifera]|eukprot:XP_002279065.2 PREDICTED: uncharacterized protein LOC100249671 isoform X1 [Vitis vinifera]
MSPYGVVLFLLLMLFTTVMMINVKEASGYATGNIGSSNSSSSNSRVEMMVPVVEERVEMVLNESRRRLGSFQICALCTCCGGAKGLCLPSPCCYAINCNIPNRPFGFCSFTPKTCNCFGCHL